jgi:hypothetical protein
LAAVWAVALLAVACVGVITFRAFGRAALVFGLILAPVALFVLLEIPALRRDRRWRRGLCARCGYDLTGNVSGVCPECGAEAE